jgi:PAS domain S-box-containing protein
MRLEEGAPAEAGYRSLFKRIPVPLYRSTPDGRALAVNPALVRMLGYQDEEILLDVPVEAFYVDPGDRERFRQILERDGSVVGFETRLRRRDGSLIWIRDSARAVVDEDGQIMYFEGAIADVTQEKHAEEQLRRQAGELSALHDTTLGLIEHLDVTQLLDDILSRAAALLETEHAYLYVVDGDELVVRAGTGRFVDYLGFRLGRGEGLAGRVWTSGEPYAVDDYREWSERRPEFDFIRAAAALPLRAGAKVVGVIGLGRTEEGREFTALEMGLVSRFARMASLVLTNARLYDAAQREIVERRRAQEELRDSESRYRRLFEGNPVPMWVFDVTSLDFLSVNDAAVEHYGYSREEFLSMTIRDIRPPEDVPDLEAEVRISNRPVLSSARQWRHRKKDGTVIDVMITSHGVNWEGRKARLVLVTDITERKRAEAALRESEERFRTMATAAPIGIFLADERGRASYINERLREMMGKPEEALLDAGWLSTVHPDDRERVGREVRRATPEGLDVSFEYRIVRPDGSERWAHAAGVPIRAPNGSVLGYVGTVADMTERHRAEEDRRRLIAELVRVQEEERRRIATEIHDDPVQAMTAVEMRLESLRRRVEDGDQRRTLEQLTASVSTAIGRLRRLLVELRPPRLDREGLASALRALLDRLRSEGGVDAELEDRTLHETPGEARTVLYRIAQEALANVRKHAEARRVRIILADRDGGVLLRVRDDGRGFEPDRTAEDRPGHLGLVSMRERAELTGGKFRITSTPGAGTTVEAWVPGEVGDG